MAGETNNYICRITRDIQCEVRELTIHSFLVSPAMSLSFCFSSERERGGDRGTEGQRDRERDICFFAITNTIKVLLPPEEHKSGLPYCSRWLN